MDLLAYPPTAAGANRLLTGALLAQQGDLAILNSAPSLNDQIEIEKERVIADQPHWAMTGALPAEDAAFTGAVRVPCPNARPK